jgi:6-phosphogluconolactonase (cycloisomerase 2 family)
VAVHPCGCLAYVVNAFTDNIFVYKIDSNTGMLKFPLVDSKAINYGPNSVAVDPTGRFVYVTASVSDVPGDVDKVWMFQVDPTTGRLIPNGNVGSRGVKPTSVAVHPNGRFAYVTNGDSFSVTMFAIDPMAGGLTSLGWVYAGAEPSAVALDPAGHFAYTANYGSDDVSMFKIDRDTGELEEIGPPVGAGLLPYSLTVDATGRFVYVTNDFSDDVSMFKIDGPTGQLKPLAPAVDAGHQPTGVAVAGPYVYVANAGGGSLTGSVSPYKIGATGLLTEIGPAVAAGGDPEAIAVVGFDPPSTIGVFRNGQWYLDNGNGQFDGCEIDLCDLPFGLPGDQAVVGDWDGDGRSQLGVFRNGQWYLDNGNGVWEGCAVDSCLPFGLPGDQAVAG